MKIVSQIENCLPAPLEKPRGSTPRTQRLCEEVATRYFGPFDEIHAANKTFCPRESASPWQIAGERFAYVKDHLTAYIRPDDLLAGALVRGDGPTGSGWHPAGEDGYISHFANNVCPKEPKWVYDMAARGLISPQGAFNHKVVDYAGFLRIGSLGMIERAENLLSGRNGIGREITEGFISGHRCMIRTAERYAGQYAKLAKTANTEKEKSEYSEMERICRKVPAYPADTFHEAMQMLWFAYMVSADGTGRPDQYLYEYYRSDLEAGNIDEARAQELIEAFMIKLHGECFEGVFNVSSVQTMTLGGCGPDGEDACNDLTRLFLQAIRSVRLLRPTVYIRCTGQTPREILELAVSMLGEGLGEPNFYGDKPVLEGLTRMGVKLEDARDYALSGCAEVVSPGKGNWGAPNGWINIAQLALEALHKTAETQPDAKSIDEFWEAYKKMCEEVAEACSIANLHTDENCADFRYESTIMYPICLENGLDVMRGGLETYFAHWEGIGLPNAADMVYAADKMAWGCEAKLSDLLHELESKQNEKLILSLRKLPKFGGDNAEVDGIAAKLVEILSQSLEARSPGCRRALFLGHLAGGENMHIAYGKHMPATLDGRRAGQPLADSMAGSQGRAGSPTAAIQSLCRLDHSRLQAGNVSTLRLTPADFATKQDQGKVAELIRAFIALGGSQLQINVLDTEILRKAQQNPQQYAGIIVRVAGYSSAFDGLGKTVQDEIIARYESLA
ncbi:MAG: hypothetical protein FWG34_09625 [Oscillospiraceae bacterium]|nr:hypothetical protein [Oscillospiraceae bacterium]